MSKAKETLEGSGEVKVGQEVTLSTGVKVELRSVSVLLMQNAQRRIEDPPVPVIEDPDKDGEKVENPWDPDYIAACKKANEKRNEVAIDIAIIRGFRLVNDIPPDEEWLAELQQMERRKMIDLSPYDIKNEFDRELVYKKFIAMGNEDWELIAKVSGLVTDEGVQAHMDSFPSDETWGEDSGRAPEAQD